MYQSLLNDESQTNRCATALANEVAFLFNQTNCLDNELSNEPLKIYFSGEIGAAKSCFIRRFLSVLGVTSKIKSPTFSIIESYQVNTHLYVHMDLYRIVDEDELHYLGFEEYFSDATIILIEWPEKVSGLPLPDLHIHLENIDFGQKRKISIQSISKDGKLLLDKFSSNKDV